MPGRPLPHAPRVLRAQPPGGPPHQLGVDTPRATCATYWVPGSAGLRQGRDPHLPEGGSQRKEGGEQSWVDVGTPPNQGRDPLVLTESWSRRSVRTGRGQAGQTPQRGVPDAGTEVTGSHHRTGPKQGWQTAPSGARRSALSPCWPHRLWLNHSVLLPETHANQWKGPCASKTLFTTTRGGS